MNINKKLKYYRSLPYTRRSQPFRDETGEYWLAWIEELEGCKAEGQAESEAFANLEGVFDDYIEAKIEWDSIIPEPIKPPVKGKATKKGRDIQVLVLSEESAKTANVTALHTPEANHEITGALALV